MGDEAAKRACEHARPGYAYWTHVDEVAALLCEEHGGPDQPEGFCHERTGPSMRAQCCCCWSGPGVSVAAARMLAPGSGGVVVCLGGACGGSGFTWRFGVVTVGSLHGGCAWRSRLSWRRSC
jgi:hypothetical protein